MGPCTGPEGPAPPDIDADDEARPGLPSDDESGPKEMDFCLVGSQFARQLEASGIKPSRA